MEARLGKEGRRRAYHRCRSVREINGDEDPLVRRLIRIADDQNRPLNLPQQAPDRGESIRDRTPLVPAGHDQIDVMRLRAGRDGTGRISDADIDAVRQLAPAQPSANLALETALGPRPPCLDDRSRELAVDNVEDDQVAVPFEREPGRSHESDFRPPAEVVGQEHTIFLLRELLTRQFQTRHIVCRSVGGAGIARADAGYGRPIAGRAPGRHGMFPRLHWRTTERAMPTSMRSYA